MNRRQAKKAFLKRYRVNPKQMAEMFVDVIQKENRICEAVARFMAGMQEVLPKVHRIMTGLMEV